MKAKFSFLDKLWDLWCICSVVGIWPRFVEPRLISTTKLTVSLPNLPEELRNLKIVQFSDLHFHPQMPESFTDKLCSKVQELKPDVIVFTGDILCCSALDESERLKKILNSLSAPYGCYAVMGNHDYQMGVSINDEGDYDIINEPGSSIARGFKRLYEPLTLTKKVTERAKNLQLHSGLVSLLSQTPFELLHNQSKVIKIKNSGLNICGVGEHMLDKCLPEIAFQQYEPKFPGIILAHNPDCLPKLTAYPGDIVLCGHTHGGQVNLPWIWKYFTLMEDNRLVRGLHQIDKKWVYVNRGIGGVLQFRWFAMPELLVLTLDKP